MDAAARRPLRARRLTTRWYINPVSTALADPSGLRNNQTGSDYYLYATGGSTGDLFPIQHSTDLVHWTSVGTAMARPPSWVIQSGDWHPWAPSVLQANRSCPGTQSPSCYYMYYTGLSAQFNVNCVAVATATTPSGPFTDQGPLSNGTLDLSGRPIGCGDNSGSGNIDPGAFVDSDGRAYLYVSTDEVCLATGTPCTAANSTLRPTISVIPLAADWLEASGERTPLFSGDSPWEQGPSAMVVEGPWMQKHNGRYYLFYSGGAWMRDYGMGFATMSSPLGPATKYPNNPILYGTSQVLSVGGGSTITGPGGGDWMLYHGRLGSYTAPRRLFIDPVIWSADGTVTVNGPTITPQPMTRRGGGAPTVALLAHANHRYVTAANARASPLVARSRAVGRWQRFRLLSNADGTNSLRAIGNGKIVTAERAGRGPLVADRVRIGLSERFQFILNGDGTFSLRALVNGRYVTAKNAGRRTLIANQTKIGWWDKFTMSES